MNLAIISLTESGKTLAENLKIMLLEDSTIFKVDTFHKNIKSTLNNIFSEYDAIIGIMATGIMVRNLADLLKTKTTDPAVIVMDEKGNNIISLLSGHLGGANQLSYKISDFLNSNPVITTATDVNGLIGIDELARKYYWKIKNPNQIRFFNREILHGEKIKLMSKNNIKYLLNEPYFEKTYEILDLDDKSNVNHDGIEAIVTNAESRLFLKPYKLVVGIGSRKNISHNLVLSALKKTFYLLDISIDRIDALATAEIKSKEEGILKTAVQLKKPLHIIKIADIKNFNSNQCSFSDFVDKNFGVPGICEPSALIAAGDNSKLIFKKTAYNGVTIAVAIAQ
ncbi:cobalt-precorrin 5A hydrolase [Methanobacterium alcaliphilum]|uniref:cobalt-precorrin 5A hydrolase n=1 Tax=Methanobacterium alcaliphilum TaxID=392018 RepID=UPI002009E2B0|nr:cobalt-precorrin 5A hydrolase [Methanobacterium alcaliphilum]MCK9151127.1 cobalt-precorrin 5A hydrolase [Methanobacterium alcaliphilum]